MKINYTLFKRLLLLSIIAAFSIKAGAQVPQLIHFQAIARDGSGNLIVKQNIQIRLSVIDSVTGKIVYQETQAPILTDTFGYFDIKLNDSTNPDWTPNSKYGAFSNISWVTAHKWLLIEYQAPSTFKYLTIGEVEFVTYPYAMVAQTAINVQGMNLANASDGDILQYDSVSKTWKAMRVAYHAGNGISISNDSVINTSPNIPVSISGTGGTTITGTYPNFTANSPVISAGAGIRLSNDSIINTSPNITVKISGTGSTSVTGTYPNFTINSPVYSGGSNIKISNDSISAFNEADTSSTPDSAKYVSATSYSSLVFADTTKTYATAPSTGLYLVLARASVEFNSSSSYSAPFAEAFLYNTTQSSYLSTSPEYIPIATGDVRYAYLQRIAYLNKGDKIIVKYLEYYISSFYYGFPGDNVMLVKIK